MSPQEIHEGTLDVLNPEQLVIMVPAESVEAYKAAPIWGDYQIREVDPNLGIGNINVDFDSDATIYSISGIRMGTSIDTLPAGIYIQGGKKLIKK